MKKLIAVACLASTVALTGTAMADSIKGRFGVTGRLGFMIPADNESDFLHNKTDAGFVGGGGLIYGLTDHIAADLDVSRSTFGSETGDFGVTDISFGVQYRFDLAIRELVPYLGTGLDLLISDYDPSDGSTRKVENTLGVNARAGVDYFLFKQLALTAEAKMLVAPDAHITDRFGVHRGNFDSTNFSSTVGIRYFFN